MINTAAEQMNFHPVFTLINNEEMNYFGSTENGKRFFDKILKKSVKLLNNIIMEPLV